MHIDGPGGPNNFYDAFDQPSAAQVTRLSQSEMESQLPDPDSIYVADQLIADFEREYPEYADNEHVLERVRGVLVQAEDKLSLDLEVTVETRPGAQDGISIILTAGTGRNAGSPGTPELTDGTVVSSWAERDQFYDFRPPVAMPTGEEIDALFDTPDASDIAGYIPPFGLVDEGALPRDTRRGANSDGDRYEISEAAASGDRGEERGQGERQRDQQNEEEQEQQNPDGKKRGGWKRWFGR